MFAKPACLRREKDFKPMNNGLLEDVSDLVQWFRNSEKRQNNWQGAPGKLENLKDFMVVEQMQFKIYIY